MRVLLVTPDFPPGKGGIQLVAHRLAVQLSSSIVGVVTLAAAGSNEVDSGLGMPVHRVGQRLGFPRWAALPALNAEAIVQIRRFRPDVILNMHMVTGPATAVARHLYGVPYVQYVYANEMLDRPWVTKTTLGYASAVVVASEFSRELAQRYGARTDQVHCISYGVDIPARTLEPRAMEPTFITVSRLVEPYKGHDVVIRAMPLITTRIPGVRWVVVGDGPLRASLERAATDMGVVDHVTFVGAVDDDERDRWLDRAHLLVMPSRLTDRGDGEGFGLAYLEAGAHGIPVIGGAVAGSMAAVEHGKTGLLVDPTDHVAVAEAIVDLLQDREASAAMGMAGRLRAHEMSWGSMAAQVEALLESVALSSARAVRGRRLMYSRFWDAKEAGESSMIVRSGLAGDASAAVPAARWQEAQAWEAEYWKHVTSDGPRFLSALAEMAECGAWADEHIGADRPISGDRVEIGIGPFGVGCIHLLPWPASRPLVGVDSLPLIPVEDLNFPEPLRELVGACREGYQHVEATGEATGLESARFSVAILHNMLDHVQDPAGVLLEAYRILSPGGWLVLACDAFSTLGRAKHLYYTTRRYPDCLEVKAHPFRFTADTLLEICRSAGFSIRANNQDGQPRLQALAGHSRRLLAVAQRPLDGSEPIEPATA